MILQFLTFLTSNSNCHVKNTENSSKNKQLCIFNEAKDDLVYLNNRICLNGEKEIFSFNTIFYDFVNYCFK